MIKNNLLFIHFSTIRGNYRNSLLFIDSSGFSEVKCVHRKEKAYLQKKKARQDTKAEGQKTKERRNTTKDKPIKSQKKKENKMKQIPVKTADMICLLF